MIKSKEVQVFETRLFCDKCGEEMVSTGLVYTTYPRRYPYICPKCEHRVIMYHKYPLIEYKEKQEE